MLPKRISINKHTIKLVDSKQLSYEPIYYSLKMIKLKIFKIYIETNLVNGFIYCSKSPADALIFFVCKFNNSLRLYINY